MSTSERRSLAAAGALALTLAACAGAATDRSGTPTGPPGTPTPAPTPTPTLAARVEAGPPLAAGEAGVWIVLGHVELEQGGPAREIALRIDLLSRDGLPLAAGAARLPGGMVAGERAPFEARIAFAGAPAGARGEVTAYAPAEFTRAWVEAAALSHTPLPEGGWEAIGMLVNLSTRAAAVQDVLVVGLRADRSPAVLAQAQAYPPALAPGESAPFVVHIPAAPGLVTVEAWIDAVVAPAPPRSGLALAEPARVVHDASGGPMIVGALRNDDARPREARLLLDITRAGSLIGAAELRMPLPLAPGETRGFALAAPAALFENLAGQEWTAGDLAVGTYVDAAASAAAREAIQPLEVRLTGIEQIGRALFLRGEVSNPWASALEGPAVLAAVRATDGALLTAGWAVLGERLEPGGVQPFVLALPWPRAADLALSEFDVIAGGRAP